MTNEDFQDKGYRDAFVDAMIRTGIAFQVKALRKRAPWSQKELGERVGTPQNVISRYEDPDYGSFSLKTLQRLAAAFDVALIVKFAPFSELMRLTENRSADVLAVASFDMEQAAATAPAEADTARLVASQIPETTATEGIGKVTPITRYKKTQPIKIDNFDDSNSADAQKGKYSYGYC